MDLASNDLISRTSATMFAQYVDSRDDEINFGNHTIGSNSPCYIIAEIGINHNGDLSIAKQLIDATIRAGCDAVKFQKRTIDVVYTPEELALPRASPFGTTNGDLKRGLEFDEQIYGELFDYCRQANIHCFASIWDEFSVEFMEQFDPPCHKIPSPMLTDDALLRCCRETNRPLILSCGMSTLEQIAHAIEVLGQENLVLMHCTSAYPCPPEDINLRVLCTLRQLFACPVGYSGHEASLWPTLAAVAMGSVMVERHVTLSRSMWGSDQAMSIEPHELSQLVQSIREIETAMGDGMIDILPSEQAALKKLRRIG